MFKHLSNILVILGTGQVNVGLITETTSHKLLEACVFLAGIQETMSSDPHNRGTDIAITK